MKKIKLKPCPFCGGKAKIIKTYSTIWVKCLDCHASTTCRPTEAEAAKIWNRRIDNE